MLPEGWPRNGSAASQTSEIPKSWALRPSFHVLRPAGEMLHVAEPFLERNLHPTVIVRGMYRALEVRSCSCSFVCLIRIRSLS